MTTLTIERPCGCRALLGDPPCACVITRRGEQLSPPALRVQIRRILEVCSPLTAMQVASKLQVQGYDHTWMDAAQILYRMTCTKEARVVSVASDRHLVYELVPEEPDPEPTPPPERKLLSTAAIQQGQLSVTVAPAPLGGYEIFLRRGSECASWASYGHRYAKSSRQVVDVVSDWVREALK